MKQSFLKELSNLQTITVRDLQSKIKEGKRHRAEQTNDRHNHHHQSCSDLNVISPFYQRINHKPNCKCKYHQRQKVPVPKIRKIMTEPNEVLLTNNRITQPQENYIEIQPVDQNQNLIENWREDLSSEDLKTYYFEYLKTLPNFDKVKRLDKLDCHNIAFQQFLKNNYLVILERKRREESDKWKERESTSGIYKCSLKILQKIYTDDNIDYETHSDIYRKEGLSSKDTSYKFDHLSSVKEELSREVRLKKLVIKSTGKTLQLVDEQQPKSRKEDNRRKKGTFLNSRPSFFGMIEDQQLLRQLCMKLMTQNKRVNKEAEMMVKQLVESDVQMYQKMIAEIEEDLEAGIKLRNLNNDQANVLVKIVLNKIRRQTQLVKDKDAHYSHKNSLIDDLCSKYGWPKDDKIIELKQFWKMRQQRQNSHYGSSFPNIQNASKGRISKNNIQSKDSKKTKQKMKIKNENRSSGLQSEKSPSRFQNSVKFVNETASKTTIEAAKPEQFKYISAKPLAKMGIFNRKEKNPRNSKFSPDYEQKNIQSSKKPFRTYKGTKQVTFEQRQQIDDVVIQLESSKSIRQQSCQIQSQSRNSSMYLNLKNQVQRHIEINKRFLKRIEHNLIDNQCERLIIGMGQGIITKKRKIRAIYEALETGMIKQSQDYGDILKYLEIYEDYCDLVIKNKRQMKSKIEQEQAALPSQKQVAEKQREEEANDIYMLLDSLKNQRGLKFIDLNLLKEQEDPREQLILKIPQYVTKPQDKKIINQEPFNQESIDGNQQTECRKHLCGIVQKDLGEAVTMQCNNNWTPSSIYSDIPSQKQSQNIANFQIKMQRFRQALKLTTQKC